MKNQVLSIEQMQELQKLGVDTSKASMFYKRGIWTGMDYPYHLLPVCDEDIFKPRNSDTRTFTLQDILELLPVYIERPLNGLNIMPLSKWDFRYENVVDECEPIVVMEDSDILQAAYKMLIWVAMNGYLKPIE